MVELIPALRSEYEKLFEDCTIRPQKAAAVDQAVEAILAKRDRYEAVQRTSGVPWHVVGVIHRMEATGNFSKHLHNGDPLTARTVQVPRGRPTAGQPPFTWEVSAADALGVKKLTADTDWSRAGTLYQLERYNGFGYRTYHPTVLSPYLWSFSNHYTAGKYVADGKWSDTAVSQQVGAAAMLRRLASRALIRFADDPVPYAATRPATEAAREAARTLQRWLNTHPGVALTADGWPGRGTSDAYRLVKGRFLPGDPRGS